MSVDREAPDGDGDGDEAGDDVDDSCVAIIGMAGRFPGAPDLERFWSNLAGGVQSMRRFTDEELLAAGESPAALRDPAYVRVCPVLDDVDEFDAGFFGFSPDEAALADPQHRLFLELAWEAFEDAGYDPARAGVVGIWAACGLSSTLVHHLVTNPELMETVGERLLRHTTNDMNFLATRVSYELDLRGPSMNVQTACSSTLVTVHLAVQSLLGRECDLALAGGSTLSAPQRGYLYKEGEILSSDGHCRPFDARARGTLFGSGAGALVLKRLRDARRDGDRVLALVRGSAINNDGSQKVGFLAPSVEGQARVIAEALGVAGIDAGSISYVEAHGTGTLIGDPIEVSGLTQAFRAHTERRGFCGLGSLKSNIGHLGEAAGVASLIKTVLALRHRQLPPSAGYELPNPNIDFATSPFYVSQRLRDWPRGAGPRRAGVTALGAGGTNAHVILEEAPDAPASGPSRAWQIIPLSARSVAGLDAATKRLAAHLRATPALSLADVAYTLQVGRRAFEHRRVAVCKDVADAVAALGGGDARRLLTRKTARKSLELVFSFPGAGAQHAGMGRELYETEPLYRDTVDECLAHARPELGVDLRPLLYPGLELPSGAATTGSEAHEAETEAADERLARPSLALPTLFATELALTRLLASWGVAPTAMIGHDVGEFVAACVAGVISARDGMRLVAKRGILLETLPPGGPGVAPRPPHGLDPSLPELERFCETITFEAPSLPYVSDLTGTWITAREASDPGYWARHLRHTARVADGLATILEQKADRVLVEVGPGRAPTSQAGEPAGALATMPGPKDPEPGAAFLMSALGQLWLAGAELDWARGHGAAARRRRVPLPTYPFERQTYRLDRVAAMTTPAPTPGALKRKPKVEDWFWLPSWTRTGALPAAAPSGVTLIFAEEPPRDGGPGLGERLAARLPGAVVVRAGAGFSRAADGSFTVAPARRADHEQLLAALRAEGKPPDEIVHLWNVSAREAGQDALARYGRAFELGFASLLALAQALALAAHPARLTIVSTGLHRVGDEAERDPLKALLLGPARVIGAELPAIGSRSVDVAWPAATPWQGGRIVDQLLAELGAPRATEPTRDQKVIAYRGAERLLQSFARAPLPAPAARGFREGGVYLITGGLGGIGATLAEHLARTARAKLVLVGRTARPERARALAERGAEALVLQADVTDLEQMRAVMTAARARFGPITGVIHAAGVRDEELLLGKTLDSAARVLAPKVKGALVLDALVREGQAAGHAPPELFLLFSSVSAVLGLEGQIDDTAANAVLDALALERTGRTPETSLSVDWGPWRDVGVAATKAARGQAPLALALREAAFRAGMGPTEGLEALERVVASRLGPQVVVTALDLDAWIVATARGSQPAAAAATAAVARTARPSVSTPFVAPRDEEEERVAGLWRTMLGLDEVGVHDDFFELGGHSLLLTQTITRLRTLAGIEIALAALLTKLTIAEMAAEVTRVRAAGQGAAAPSMKAVSRDAYRAKRPARGAGRATSESEEDS